MNYVFNNNNNDDDDNNLGFILIAVKCPFFHAEDNSTV